MRKILVRFAIFELFCFSCLFWFIGCNSNEPNFSTSSPGSFMDPADSTLYDLCMKNYDSSKRLSDSAHRILNKALAATIDRKYNLSDRYIDTANTIMQLQEKYCIKAHVYGNAWRIVMDYKFKKK